MAGRSLGNQIKSMMFRVGGPLGLRLAHREERSSVSLVLPGRGT